MGIKKGGHLTDEWKQKIRETMLAKKIKRSKRTRRKLSDALRGKKRTEETKKKIKRSWDIRKQNNLNLENDNAEGV
jgi:hypothetical protein